MKESEIRIRINKALYTGPCVDVKEAFDSFLDWSMFLEVIGLRKQAMIAEQIANGYLKRATCLAGPTLTFHEDVVK